MKPVTLSLALYCCALACPAQTSFNLNFETIDPATHGPSDWNGSFKSHGASGFVTALDSTTVKEGKYAVSIAPDPDAAEHRFGACVRVIPAIYAGETIELRGFLKTENVGAEGFAGLWMRINGDNGVLAFDNMQQQSVNGTNDWTEYAITLPLDAAATRINVGGLLVGTGKVWLDDLRLFIDGKPIETAPVKVVTKYPAQLDSAFYAGSGIAFGQLSPEQINNLALAAKVWGFLKYHHPAITKGGYNWDFELFRILPALLKSKSAGERDGYFLAWIEQLGALPDSAPGPQNAMETPKMAPDLAWIDHSGLDKRLAARLHLILQNTTPDKQYYLSLVPGVGNPVFEHENPYPNFVYPDAGYRLLALFRYWNMIRYFFPYKYAIGEDWDKVLEQSVAEFAEAPDALAYRLALLRLIARVSDTHANLWGRDSILNAYYGDFFAPVQLRFVENQAVVTDFYDTALAANTGLHIGDVILEVDGKQVADIIAQRLPLTPASNYATQLRDIARDLLRGPTAQVQVLVRQGQNKVQKTIDRYPAKSLNFRGESAAGPSEKCYRFLSPEIGYVSLGNIQSKALPEIFEQFRATKGLVIDIRNYPADFVVFSLGKYLMPQPTDFVRFSNADLQRPGYFALTAPLAVGEDNPDYYKGTVVILVDERSQSQAEYTAMAFRAAPGAKVIGSTTAGADGNVSRIPLPGNLQTMISGIGVYYPDGRETQRVGIVPDIEVKPTIRGIQEGRDEVLERAMALIQTGK